MNFKYSSFLKELQEAFSDDLPVELVADTLGNEDAYNRDSPISTGKNLQVTRLFFEGQKITEEEQTYSNDPILYDRSIASGINIWVADNLKGKSSILKIIKYALTGSDSIKDNIKKWIKHILLNFKIGAKEYTIYFKIEARLKAKLFNGTITTIAAIDESVDEPLIDVKSETEYQAQIQEFFFNQFSYYPLKWTQKHPSKDRTDLVEAKTSWASYFKSIFLESKDFGTFIYGDQEKKVFQMLLGLELTYPINQLTVKRDLLNEKKGKQNLYEQMTPKKSIDVLDELQTGLAEINTQLDALNEKDAQEININDLYIRYNVLLKEMSDRNEKILSFEENINLLRNRTRVCENKITTNNQEIGRLTSEVDKNIKRIADLQEFLEIGIFFSNLDIKRCPSCDHAVTESKKKIEKDQHKCALCSEDLPSEEGVQDKEVFLEKIANLEKINLELQRESELLLSEKQQLAAEMKSNETMLADLGEQASDQKDKTSIAEELKKLEAAINLQKQKVIPGNVEKDKLIREKTILEFRIEQFKNEEAAPGASENYDKQIALVNAALVKLNKARFDLGKTVITRLQDLMLQEIHAFGLTSVTEIEISDKYDIRYKQDGEFITFDKATEGEQLRSKIAFYLSLIQLDIENNFGRHTRFLMIDSPGKEEGDASYLEGLSGVLKSVQSRFGDKLQILIGTAERGLSNIVENEYITPPNTYVF